MSFDPCRAFLEARQISIYFAAVLSAFLAAWVLPGMRGLSVAIDALLALMLFVTFVQVPMGDVGRALSDLRFVGTLLLANFIVLPALLTFLLPWVPGDPLIRIGVLMVLLTPCIDYVVTFAHLGRADARSLLAATPVLLLCQMLLLPFYLGLFLGEEAARRISWEPFAHAFVWFIALPLALATICQSWAARGAAGKRGVRWLGLMPVPATAALLWVVVASVTPELGQAWPAVGEVVPVYAAFALLAPIAGWLTGWMLRLPPAQRRAVAFSSATRNSLVVLPLALAIPGALPVLPAVIVTQTLIELLAELVYVRAGRGGSPDERG
ncbi:arsenic resistance protein [Bordetella avium]|uniref:arsenic resistance protein n=1 Tax=Bordetella avium TaxID=521 RepID=UPI000FD94D75|nr:arsenic resistance protein [Bordetella avium]AZY50202.1 arsenic resistance protein [Bordetella avium]